MNERELRELLAAQASVIHELRRDAAGMSAIIADLRGRVKHKPPTMQERIQEQVAAVVRDTMADAEVWLGRWRSHEEDQEEQGA